jgi:hypothetical protein
VLSLSKTGEYNAAEDVDPYKDYQQLIVGKWFCFTPELSIFLNYQPDKTFSEVAWDKNNGWYEEQGTYNVEGNILTTHSNYEVQRSIEVSKDKFRILEHFGFEGLPKNTHYRVQESFDIKGNYYYLNSAVKVEPVEGKTALQLPEGVLFQGQNYIPVDAMHGDRIIDVMKKFFADATFAADGKLNHTLDGEAKVKNYTLNGNNLVFNLYEGSDTYKVNATSFPDEDGDRLFIIIPKQAAWLGGMVDLVEKENEGLKLDAAQIAALEKEFMETFETFTVILSLSKK